MANKHDRAFAEVTTRFFIPFDSDEMWKNLDDITLIDLLTKPNSNFIIHKPSKKKEKKVTINP